MEKHYYDFDSITQNCFTDCQIRFGQHKTNHIKIGSAACKKCDNCIDFSDNEGWIVCEKIDDALGNDK